jgi:hypothetical protein
MPGVVRRRDGTLFAVFEASDLAPYRFAIRAVRSRDGGKNWSPARELVYKPANPVRACWAAGAPTVVQLRKGRLLVSFQTDEDVAYKRGDPRRDPLPAPPGADITLDLPPRLPFIIYTLVTFNPLTVVLSAGAPTVTCAATAIRRSG